MLLKAAAVLKCIDCGIGLASPAQNASVPGLKGFGHCYKQRSVSLVIDRRTYRKALETRVGFGDLSKNRHT